MKQKCFHSLTHSCHANGILNYVSSEWIVFFVIEVVGSLVEGDVLKIFHTEIEFHLCNIPSTPEKFHACTLKIPNLWLKAMNLHTIGILDLASLIFPDLLASLSGIHIKKKTFLALFACLSVFGYVYLFFYLKTKLFFLMIF